jgi:NADPH oxidase 1
MGESWIQREIFTLRRLIFNFLWYGSQIGVFAYGWYVGFRLDYSAVADHDSRYSQQTNVKLAGLNDLKFSVWVSRGAGLVLAYDGFLILVPMLRNIIRVVRPKLAWLFPADENIWLYVCLCPLYSRERPLTIPNSHRQVAYSMAFWAMLHTTAHYVNFINVERSRIRPLGALDIHYKQAGGITGHVMLLIMVLMCVVFLTL